MKKTLSLSLLAGMAICCSVATSGFVQAETNSLPPINSGGVVMIDLPTSTAESIRLDIKEGRFAAQSVGHLTLDAQGVDFRKGTLKSLTAHVKNGHFDNALVDDLLMKTQAFSFDTFELLNRRRFVLDNPVNSDVSLRISEDSFNRYFSSPQVIGKLEKAVAKKTGNFSLLTFSNPTVKFLDRSRVRLSVMTSVANAMAAPMEFDGRIAADNGKLVFKNLKMSSNGVQVPIDVSSVFEKKLNEMIDLERMGKNNFVIRANSVSMSKGMLEVRGQAALTRLEFGQ